jgi:hypothetical protein
MVSLAGDSPLEKPVSVAELRERILLALEQKLTGMAKISFSNGEAITLLISGGNIRQVYYQDGSVSRVSPNFWLSSQFSEKLASLSIKSFPAQRLLFEKIILESEAATREKRRNFQTSALAAQFSVLLGRECASLVRIQWQSAEAFVLIPGSKLARRSTLFLNSDSTEEDAHAIDSIEKWHEANCELTIYPGSLNSEAWQETHLKVLFESLCNRLLTEYGYLTGRVMITILIQNLMILASQNGWELNRRGNGVIDQTIFVSPQEAAAAYRRLLEMALTHMGAVVGSALAQSVKWHGMDSYNTFYLNLIKTYELM